MISPQECNFQMDGLAYDKREKKTSFSKDRTLRDICYKLKILGLIKRKNLVFRVNTRELDRKLCTG